MNEKERPLILVKPKLDVLLFVNVVKIVLVFGFVLGMFYWVMYQAGFDTFGIVLEAYGIEFDKNAFINPLLFASLGVILLIIYKNSIAIKQGYEFYKNRMVCYDSVLFVFTKVKIIDYSKIKRIYHELDGLVNNIYKCGTIVIEISGLKDKKIVMEYIEDTSMVSKRVNKLVYNYNAVKQSRIAK